ncbi:hypothetical protein [Halobiforma nitratireducens]|uniref:Uncharacterized protein n=1 Tax=Halobiforma nitratireducens JCM 10879 TaxID=1227454 RepID=M0L746_9EURY|nr:hypothetical protein [Halobiforma nitratireducens]EMA29412.1 hypothetical protein C446_17157 [Halobiforma nitratireducens JCM 10879]
MADTIDVETVGFVALSVVTVALALFLLSRLVGDIKQETTTTQKEKALITMGGASLFGNGLVVSQPAYVLSGGLFAIVGMARMTSDRFDQWAENRHLFVLLAAAFVTGAFFYDTWEGAVPAWFP